jgi:hypothetical protein
LPPELVVPASCSLNIIVGRIKSSPTKKGRSNFRALVPAATPTRAPLTKLGIDGGLGCRDGTEARKEKPVTGISSAAAGTKARPFSAARDPGPVVPRAVFRCAQLTPDRQWRRRSPCPRARRGPRIGSGVTRGYRFIGGRATATTGWLAGWFSAPDQGAGGRWRGGLEGRRWWKWKKWGGRGVLGSRQAV